MPGGVSVSDDLIGPKWLMFHIIGIIKWALIKTYLQIYITLVLSTYAVVYVNCVRNSLLIGLDEGYLTNIFIYIDWIFDRYLGR